MKLGKKLGIGNTATVYQCQNNKVLKLFAEGYPKTAVIKEFNNALAINNMYFSKPKVYEMINYKGQFCIVYDEVNGDSLLELVLETGDVKSCAKYMADLHKQILINDINEQSILSYKVLLKEDIENAQLKIQEKVTALQILDRLPSCNKLCHGDFHPGNILIKDDNATVIDFMNICKGPFLFDVARTVYLMQYTPIPAEVANKDQFLKLKKDLTDLYLAEMDTKREEIKDFLEVIAVARKGECPEEF